MGRRTGRRPRSEGSTGGSSPPGHKPGPRAHVAASDVSPSFRVRWRYAGDDAVARAAKYTGTSEEMSVQARSSLSTPDGPSTRSAISLRLDHRRRCPHVFQCVEAAAGSRLAGLKSAPL